MANFNNKHENRYNPFLNRSSVDILASIMQHCNSATNSNIMAGLSKDKETTKVTAELKLKVRTFDDLAYVDARGMQKLLKLASIKDLATALRGANQSVIQNVASNMSRNNFLDLKYEIDMTKNISQKDIFEARDRILEIVSELISLNELYINRGL